MKNIGLYIHIPFRIYKHNHRGVLSFFNKDFYIKSYFKYLKKELKLRKDENLLIDSIYIGGGDPSSMDTIYVTDLLDYIYENFNVEKDCEKTIELDPHCPEIRIMRYIEHGINRFSIKVFTFEPKGLENLDLTHRKSDVLDAIKFIKKYKVNNINLDMYFSYPEQTKKSLISDLEIIGKLNVPHISFYSAKTHVDGDVILDEDNIESDLKVDYIKTIESYMEKLGYEHYEINHYSKLGFGSVHNEKYWSLAEYMGVGLGATGLIGDILYKNETTFEAYFERLDKGEKPYLEKDFMNSEDFEKYYILNKMNMKKGIKFRVFKERFGRDLMEAYGPVVDKYVQAKIIIKDDIGIRFTKQGIAYSNEFYMDIL